MIQVSQCLRSAASATCRSWYAQKVYSSTISRLFVASYSDGLMNGSVTSHELFTSVSLLWCAVAYRAVPEVHAADLLGTVWPANVDGPSVGARECGAVMLCGWAAVLCGWSRSRE